MSTAGGPAPATYPIVLAFGAMNAFLEAEQIELHRIIHGEQRFAYERPIRSGDVLTATLTVDSLRADRRRRHHRHHAAEVTDADGALVCTTQRHAGPPEEA